jgi:hypothetical protein
MVARTRTEALLQLGFVYLRALIAAMRIVLALGGGLLADAPR